jgi:hypothetical protein
VPLLAKISNLIPGAGIWLNTQRPEWNDANNALAGFGLSMVTLYHARRYAAFLKDLLGTAPETLAFSAETAAWFRESLAALGAYGETYLKGDSQPDPKGVVEPLGRAASAFRQGLYAKGFSGERAAVAAADLRA